MHLEVVAEHPLPFSLTCSYLSSPVNSSLFVAYGSQSYVHLYPHDGVRAVARLEGICSPATALCIDPQNRTVVAGCHMGSICTWNIEKEAEVTSLEHLHRAAVSSIESHANGFLVASASLDAVLRVWDLRGKGCVQSYKDSSSPLCHVKFLGKWVATACTGGLVRLYNLKTSKEVKEFNLGLGKNSTISSLSFHPSRQLLAVGCSNGTCTLFDLHTFDSVWNASLVNTAVDAIVWSEARLFVLGNKRALIVNLDLQMNDTVVDAPWDSLTAAVFSSTLSNEIFTLQTTASLGLVGHVQIASMEQLEQSHSSVDERSGDTVLGILQSHLAHVREIRELWYRNQPATLLRIKTVTDQGSTSLLHDFLSVMQQQSMKEKLKPEAVPYLLDLARYATRDKTDPSLALLGVRTIRSTNTRFRARAEENLRRGRQAKNDAGEGDQMQSILTSLREAAQDVLPLVTRVDQVGIEARQLVPELPS